MAYLRPLNSSEANLFTIRFTSPDVMIGNLPGVSSNHYLIDSTTYINPTSDLLPSGFNYSIGDSVSQNYVINFGTMLNPYTEPPTVTINLMPSTACPTGNLTGLTVVIESVTISSLIFTVRDASGIIIPYNSGGPTLTSPIFNIVILGSVISGATFAISNRGWNVPESAVNKLYTYQKVGVGTGKIDGNLNLKGSLVTPAYIPAIINNGTTSQTTIVTNILSNYLSILSVDTSLSSTITLTLLAGYNGQIIRINLMNTALLGQAGVLQLAGPIANGPINLIARVVSPSLNVCYKMTELYYDGTTSLWRLLQQVAI